MLWVIYTFFSAFLFGIKDILAKKVLMRNIHPIELILHEYFFLFFFIFILFYSKIDFLSYQSLWHLYIFKASCLLITSYMYFKFLEKYEISIVTPLLNLSPIFLLVLSSLFLSELINSVQLIGILIILFSTYYLEIIIHHHDKENPHAHHFNLIKNSNSYFLISAIFMLLAISFSAIFDKKILEQTTVYTNLFFTSIIILFFLVIYYIKMHKSIQIISNLKTNPILFFIALITNISTLLILSAIALPGVLVTLIVSLRRTSSIFSSLLGGLLFHEKHLVAKMSAISIMIIGVILVISKDLVFF